LLHSRGANFAIYYLYGDNRTITLCDHIGVPVRVKGEIFQSKLGNKENADDAARALCHRSRGATTQWRLRAE
jgi:hypothetical protein